MTSTVGSPTAPSSKCALPPFRAAASGLAMAAVAGVS